MRVTLLGHASVLVELDGATCLMDPVLADPFEEGTVVSCPKRTIDADRLPPIDLLVVSHRHPDHFDLRSLACIDRDADAICPADPLIVYALEELGFPNVHPVHHQAGILGSHHRDERPRPCGVPRCARRLPHRRRVPRRQPAVVPVRLHGRRCPPRVRRRVAARGRSSAPHHGIGVGWMGAPSAQLLLGPRVVAPFRRHPPATPRRGGIRVEPRPLPDLLVYYVLQVAEGSDLSAKHEVDHQLRVLREHTAG